MEDNKNKKVLNVPTLRFPEFSGEWKLTNLNNLYFSYNSLSGKNKIDFENGNSKYVTYLNVFENVKIEKIFSRVRVSNDELQNSILNNDMFVTLSSETPEEVAISSCLDFKIDENIYLNSFCFGLRPKVEVNSLFTAYMIRSPKLRKRIFPLAQGSTRFNLNKEHFLEKLKIYICNKKEQSKIANFLSLIDKRIELQNKIIRDYKLLKKLMNDRLIYKNENKVMLPLNEFATLKNGYVFKGNINFKDGKYSVITITNVTGDRLCNIKSINKVNHLPLDIQKHQILKSTDILISLTGNVGRVSYCGINNGLLNQRVGLLEIFDKQKVEYIFQALSNKKFEKRMILLAQGGSQLNLSKNDIEKYKIPLVSDMEVNKISNLLMRYDLKILLGKNLLSNYKKVKKFLLMQLFI